MNQRALFAAVSSIRAVQINHGVVALPAKSVSRHLELFQEAAGPARTVQQVDTNSMLVQRHALLARRTPSQRMVPRRKFLASAMLDILKLQAAAIRALLESIKVCLVMANVQIVQPSKLSRPRQDLNLRQTALAHPAINLTGQPVQSVL